MISPTDTSLPRRDAAAFSRSTTMTGACLNQQAFDRLIPLCADRRDEDHPAAEFLGLDRA